MCFVEWFRNTFDGWLKGRYNTKLPQDFVIVAVNIILVEYDDSLWADGLFIYDLMTRLGLKPDPAYQQVHG